MKKTIIITFLIINSFILFSQTSEELFSLKNINKEIDNHKHYKNKNYNNELDFIFSNLFIFYKNFISSQDVSDCSFTPSCSVYALNAIKSQGVIKGAVNFFDRFTYCNGINQDYYEIDKKLKLLIDPVRNIKYENIQVK